MKNIEYRILDTLEASIYWKDLEGRYLGCNRYMENIVGLTRDKIIGQNDYYLSWKNEADKLREVDQLVIHACKKYELEEAVASANGTRLILLSYKSPLLNDLNEIIGIAGVSVNVTNNKKLVSQLAKNEQTTREHLKINQRFLHDMSYEVKIPLRSIVSIIKTDKRCGIKAAVICKHSKEQN